MKKLICLIALFKTITLLAETSVDLHDTTLLIEDHGLDGIPYYTPLVSMFEYSGTQMAFGMIIGKDEVITYNVGKGDCGFLRKCGFNWFLNVESQPSSNSKLLRNWVERKGGKIKRLSINQKYDLLTFIVSASSFKRKRIRLQMGDHPQLHEKTHQGGAIHWPTGS